MIYNVIFQAGTEDSNLPGSSSGPDHVSAITSKKRQQEVHYSHA